MSGDNFLLLLFSRFPLPKSLTVSHISIELNYLKLVSQTTEGAFVWRLRTRCSDFLVYQGVCRLQHTHTVLLLSSAGEALHGQSRSAEKETIFPVCCGRTGNPCRALTSTPSNTFEKNWKSNWHHIWWFCGTEQKSHSFQRDFKAVISTTDEDYLKFNQRF